MPQESPSALAGVSVPENASTATDGPPNEPPPPIETTLADRDHPTIEAILDERLRLEREALGPCRVIAELNTLSTLRIEASQGPFEGYVTSDANGAWRFQDLPLTLVSRVDVPARGWTILTRK